MRPIGRPGPKSKSRLSHPKKRPVADLGETSTSEESGTSFRSPIRDENVTDYGLDFTGSPRRSVRGPPSRAPTPAARKSVNAASRQEVTTSQAPKKRKQKFPARKEIRRLLNRTDFMIPRAAFGRVVREILMSLESDVVHFTMAALGALQTATEKYMEDRFEDANLLALHSRRVTLMVRDLELIQCILGRYCI